jgi:hypothetical protein
MRFGEVDNVSAGELGRNVFLVERGLISQRPGIPRRFLLDDGADNFRPQRMRFGGAPREGDEFCWRRERIHEFCRYSGAAGIGFIAPVQLQEANGRWILNLYAVVRGKTVQNAINMRQVIGSHVAHEGAFDVRVTQAAMQPSQEHKKLREQRKGEDQPIWVHACSSTRTYRRLLQRALPANDGCMSLTEDQVRTIFARLASGKSEKFFEHVDENVRWRVTRRWCKK